MSSQYERELRKLLEELDYIVVRSAGSMGEGDLVVLDPVAEVLPHIIEVKSVKGDVYYSCRTDTDKEQYTHMRKMQEILDGIEYLYAVRFKGQKSLHGEPLNKKWRMYDPRFDHIFRLGGGTELSEHW